MKLSLAANLMLNWVCAVLSFPERFQPITSAMCTVAINVLESGAINPESQYFIPLFNKISWLCGQQPGGDEASNEGCNPYAMHMGFPSRAEPQCSLGKWWRGGWAVGLMRKVSPRLSYPVPCFSFFFFKPLPRIPTPFGFFLGWIKHMGMWWGLDIFKFSFLGFLFIKPCGHVGLASCPPLV
jgi:hypothetical protein